MNFYMETMKIYDNLSVDTDDSKRDFRYETDIKPVDVEKVAKRKKLTLLEKSVLLYISMGHDVMYGDAFLEVFDILHELNSMKLIRMDCESYLKMNKLIFPEQINGLELPLELKMIIFSVYLDYKNLIKQHPEVDFFVEGKYMFNKNDIGEVIYHKEDLEKLTKIGIFEKVEVPKDVADDAIYFAVSKELLIG